MNKLQIHLNNNASHVSKKEELEAISEHLSQLAIRNKAFGGDQEATELLRGASKNLKKVLAEFN